MRETRKTIALAFLAMMLAMGLMALAGCGNDSGNTAPESEDSASTQEAQDNSEDKSASDTESPGADDTQDAASYQAGMPVTLSANGKDYLVESYEVKASDDGNTVVVLYGPDFEMGSDWRDNMDVYLCFSADCEAAGQSYPASIVSVQNLTSYQFEFEGSITPDSITVYPQDDPTTKTTIHLEE